MEQRGSQYTPVELARELHAKRLKYADVTAHSRLTGQNRTDAAKSLVGMDIDGRKIEQARGKFIAKTSRIRAATRVFTESI